MFEIAYCNITVEAEQTADMPEVMTVIDSQSPASRVRLLTYSTDALLFFK